MPRSTAGARVGRGERRFHSHVRCEGGGAPIDDDVVFANCYRHAATTARDEVYETFEDAYQRLGGRTPLATANDVIAELAAKLTTGLTVASIVNASTVFGRVCLADLAAVLAARGFAFPRAVLPSAALFSDDKFQDCKRLGLFRHPAEFVVEASPVLCLVACGDFGGTDAMPAEGNSFEELLIAKHVRDCDVEGYATAVFRLTHPLPAASTQDTVISRSMMAALQAFLSQARSKGAKAAAVVRNGPSAQGPDLFVLLVNGSDITVQLIGANDHQTSGGEWTAKFSTLGCPLPLRSTPVELARAAAGSVPLPRNILARNFLSRLAAGEAVLRQLEYYREPAPGSRFDAILYETVDVDFDCPPSDGRLSWAIVDHRRLGPWALFVPTASSSVGDHVLFASAATKNANRATVTNQTEGTQTL